MINYILKHGISVFDLKHFETLYLCASTKHWDIRIKQQAWGFDKSKPWQAGEYYGHILLALTDNWDENQANWFQKQLITATVKICIMKIRSSS